MSCIASSYCHKIRDYPYVHCNFPPRGYMVRGSLVGTVSCSARWTGWLVQVSEAEGLRGLGVVVMMVNLVGGRQTVAVAQDDRGWSHRWGPSAGDAVRASRSRWLLTAVLSIEVPSPLGSRVLEPNLCERCRISLPKYSVIWTKWRKCEWGTLSVESRYQNTALFWWSEGNASGELCL